MNNTLKILIVDDDPNIVEKLGKYLKKRNFIIYTAQTPFAALKIFEQQDFDICFLDLVLPEIDGLELLKRFKKINSDPEIILISGFGTMDTLIEAIRHGAFDFIKKPFNFLEIDLVIARTKRYLNIQQELQTTRDKYSLISMEMEKSIEMNLVGQSQQIKKVLELAVLAGKDNDINVLITGENGTGKEIVARIIHFTSARKQKSFHPINSTAIPETLLESEFFGHKKGAFTDAREDKKGVFELTDGGTLFLDEIADMPVTLQSKLLRAIEERKIKPIGAEKFVSVDTRIISATNRDIDELIDENKFRRDFYHRINTFIINIPPLRERPEDIQPLLDYFLSLFAKRKGRNIPEVDVNAIKELKKYHFPGNVRELKNMVERAFLVSKKSKLELSDFIIQRTTADESAKLIDLNMEYNEKKLVGQALNRADYNQLKAAKYLGISRDALIRRMRKYGYTISKSIR